MRPRAPAGDEGAGGGAGEPRRGGERRFAVASDAGCAGPRQVASDETVHAVRRPVDPLTDQDPGTGGVVPRLARSWEVCPDGSPVDAAAVAADLDTAGSLGARATLAANHLAGRAGTEVLDPLTARVSFAAPNAQFLQATWTSALGLVPVADTRCSAQGRCEGIVGSGPFVLDEHVGSDRHVLSRRAGHDWGSSLRSRPGEALLDRTVLSVVPEAGVRSGSPPSRQVDAISSLSPQDVQLTTTGGGGSSTAPSAGSRWGPPPTVPGRRCPTRGCGRPCRGRWTAGRSWTPRSRRRTGPRAASCPAPPPGTSTRARRSATTRPRATPSWPAPGSSSWAGYHHVPAVEQTAVLATTDAVHDLAFEASSRLQLPDTRTTGGDT